MSIKFIILCKHVCQIAVYVPTLQCRRRLCSGEHRAVRPKKRGPSSPSPGRRFRDFVLGNFYCSVVDAFASSALLSPASLWVTCSCPSRNASAEFVASALYFRLLDGRRAFRCLRVRLHGFPNFRGQPKLPLRRWPSDRVVLLVSSTRLGRTVLGAEFEF